MGADVVDEGRGAAQVEADERATMLETRLREMEHRLANTLQLIVALLQLQARQAHPEASRALMAAAERVSAIGTLYSDLIVGDAIGAVDLRQRLDEYIALQRRIAPDNIALSFASRAESCIVPRETAINLMIVINELITNALKHAFPGGRGGEIAATLSGWTGGHSIVIADNGIGTSWSPEAFGFGLQIAGGLVEYLGGGIESIPVASGTYIEVRFPTPHCPAAP